MFKKVMNYVREIGKAERLERRSIKEWEEKGTIEEAVKVFKMQKTKERSNTIAGLVYTGAIVASAGAAYLNSKKLKRETKVRKQIEDMTETK
jgi:hypothetical protein